MDLKAELVQDYGKSRLLKIKGNLVLDLGKSEPITIAIPKGYEDDEIYSAIGFIVHNIKRTNNLKLVLANKTFMKLILDNILVRSQSRYTFLNYIHCLSKVMKITGLSPDELVKTAMKDKEAVEKMLINALKSMCRRGLSHSSVKMFTSYLRTFFKVNGVDLKLNLVLRAITYQYASRAPTPEEVAYMIDLTTNPRDKALIALMATSGLRISEAIKLKYKYLMKDLEIGGIPVAIHVPAEITKGRYGARTTFINIEAVDYLKKWLKQWEMLVGRPIKPDDYIFISLKRPRPDRPVDTCSWLRVFSKIRRKMGLEFHSKRYEITVHGLRKFFKTQLIAKGVPEEVVEYMLGHRSDTYTRIESLGEDYLRDQYVKAGIKLRRLQPLDEDIKEQLKQYLRALGVPESEWNQYIKGCMTLLSAGSNIEDFENIYRRILSYHLSF